ncbi:MAG: hypothetical protein INQ03_09090 [Candidatus Heimdallarchaeota archaeon]|nr:hypothetical protein [Candidatus Heimdallarchaeota archaeon]
MSDTGITYSSDTIIIEVKTTFKQLEYISYIRSQIMKSYQERIHKFLPSFNITDVFIKSLGVN